LTFTLLVISVSFSVRVSSSLLYLRNKGGDEVLFPFRLSSAFGVVVVVLLWELLFE